MTDPVNKTTDPRPCTCHPDERPVPCQHKYAMSDCVRAAASVQQTTLPAYADPAHPGNRIRPRVRCLGCGKAGCGTAWGPWCIPCNVQRIGRISAGMNEIARSYGIETDDRL